MSGKHRHLETKVEEHKDACNNGYTEKSAIVELQWDQQHQLKWEDTRVLDKATRPIQLKVNEAITCYCRGIVKDG